MAAASGLAVLAVVVVLLAVGGTSRAGRGCVTVSLAYSTGGEQISRCGTGARALCAGAGRPGGVTGQPGQALAQACRRARLPAG